MDMSKPVGDACRPDGTLKDASEIHWADSPTDHNHALIEEQFNNNGFEDQPTLPVAESDSESDEAPKVKVRYICFFFLGDLLRHVLWLANEAYTCPSR